MSPLGMKKMIASLGSPSLALPLGELSPKVTERALSVLAALGHLSQRERQGGQTVYSSPLPATSPKGRGKGWQVEPGYRTPTNQSKYQNYSISFIILLSGQYSFGYIDKSSLCLRIIRLGVTVLS